MSKLTWYVAYIKRISLDYTFKPENMVVLLYTVSIICSKTHAHLDSLQDTQYHGNVLIVRRRLN